MEFRAEKSNRDNLNSPHDPLLYQSMYRSLRLIRRTEERIVEIYPTDKVKSPVHLSIGQEAISVAVCQALEQQDAVFGSYRCHALYLAKNGDLNKMMAELYGKVTGCGHGKAGSMHLTDVANGVIATSAVVGTTVPLAVGYAHAQKYRRTGYVTVCFLGDGAVDEGSVHESLLFATMKQTPILFVCENNSYAIHSHHHTRHKNPNFIYDWAKSYGMEVLKFETDDVEPIYQATQHFAVSMKEGQGPFFMECYTQRWKEHVGPGDDFNLGYRNEKEVLGWKQADQMNRLGQLLGETIRAKIDSEIEEKLEAAVTFAEASPFPDQKHLFENSYEYQSYEENYENGKLNGHDKSHTIFS